MGKNLKEKNPKALAVHPLNEMTEFVHERRKNGSQNFEMKVQKIFQSQGIPNRLIVATIYC